MSVERSRYSVVLDTRKPWPASGRKNEWGHFRFARIEGLEPPVVRASVSLKVGWDLRLWAMAGSGSMLPTGIRFFHPIGTGQRRSRTTMP